MERTDLRGQIIPKTINNTDSNGEFAGKKFNTTDAIYLDSFDGRLSKGLLR